MSEPEHEEYDYKDAPEWHPEPFPMTDIHADGYEEPTMHQSNEGFQVVWSDMRTGWYIEGPRQATAYLAMAAWDRAMLAMRPAPKAAGNG